MPGPFMVVAMVCAVSLGATMEEVMLFVDLVVDPKTDDIFQMLFLEDGLLLL